VDENHFGLHVKLDFERTANRKVSVAAVLAESVVGEQKHTVTDRSSWWVEQSWVEGWFAVGLAAEMKGPLSWDRD
jgi:hypothetical protein